MKQLRIDYKYYDKDDEHIYSDIFITTFFDELPSETLISSLKLLKSGSGSGWYTITNICIL